MRSMTTDISRQLCEDTARLIADGWHLLLSCYPAMRLKIEGALPMVALADDLKPSAEADALRMWAQNRDFFAQRGTRDLIINMNGAQIGTLTVVEAETAASVETLLGFVDQAAALRFKDQPEFLFACAQGLLDASGQLVWMNGPMTELARIASAPLQEVLQSSAAHAETAGEEALEVSEIVLHQYRMLLVRIPVLNAKEGRLHFFILSENTPDPKAAVIKEIHHRVKNNLQTIASLLRLQMRRVNSKKVENAFNESINRISSIALIHEELSRGGIDKINIKSATANIMEMVLSSMVPPGKNITGELSGSDLYQDADKASSLSLCITELIQNSVEHAFQMRKKGVIKVDIGMVDGDAVITISDNGIGFGGKKSRNSLGLEIIEMITVEKLKGTFEISGQINGTTSVIRFPLQL